MSNNRKNNVIVIIIISLSSSIPGASINCVKTRTCASHVMTHDRLSYSSCVQKYKIVVLLSKQGLTAILAVQEDFERNL